MKLKILILLFSLLLFAYQMYLWSFCNNLNSNYHFSIYQMKITTDNLIHNDIGLPINLIRLYHNKIIIFINEIYNIFIMFLDVKLLVNMILPIGILGLISFGININEFLRKYYIKASILVFTLFLFYKILLNPSSFYFLQIMTIGVFMEFYSLLGLSKFLDKGKRKRKILFILLFVWFSVFWQIFLGKEILNFCF